MATATPKIFNTTSANHNHDPYYHHHHRPGVTMLRRVNEIDPFGDRMQAHVVDRYARVAPMAISPISTTDSSSSASSRSSTSRSIPIQKHIHRTPSETQLREEEALADYRDYCMYKRIIGGISKQQMELITDLDLRYENDATLESIIRTRHEPAPPMVHIVGDENDHDADFIFFDHSEQDHEAVFVLDM